MKAMILAAGFGTRMRPLTDHTPKPLLPLGTSTIIEHHLKNLAKAGITDVVINVSYLAEKIEQKLGSGERYGLNIVYSRELQPLETAGGIQQALPLLGEEPFLLLNGDIWSDMSLTILKESQKLLGKNLAHIVLVNNPEHHLSGDFSITAEGSASIHSELPKLTFSGMSVISPELFSAELNSNRLADFLRKAMSDNLVSAFHYKNLWVDIGTPERLAALQKKLKNNDENS